MLRRSTVSCPEAMSETGRPPRRGLGALTRRLRRTPTRVAPDELLAPGAGRQILVVIDGPVGAGAVPDRWRVHLAGDRVSVAVPEELREVVRRLPVLDAVVCLAEDPDDPGRVVRETYRSLRDRGVLVLDRTDAGGGLGPLVEWLAGLDERAGTGNRLQRDLADSLPAREVAAAYAVLTKRGRHLLALREAEVAAALPAREPEVGVDVVEARPAGELVSTSVVVSHGEHATEFPTRYAYPELALRHYRGPVVARGRTLMYTGTTILPDSFRFHLGASLRHPFLDTIGGDWSRLQPGRVPTPLAGSYYQLESTFAHHYGHVMAEVVSRLWGWDAAKRADPSVRVLLHRGLEDPPEVPLERRVFEAYGIAPDDILVVDEPVEVDSVFSATPMWHQHPPYYVHPGMRETYERLAHGFTGGDPDGGEAHERIFVSRGEGAVNRACRNQAEVEAWFAGHGFEIVYPERHSLGEQVHLFRRAREVAGFGGSGMFNVVHAHGLQKLVVLNHEAYIARNEHMFCSLIGAEEHYLWSTPDIVSPDGRYSDEAFKSPWTFDFERNREALEKIVG